MEYYKKSIFIFRRDLRLHDNTGLIAALNKSEEVLPCFIFDDTQITPHPYLSIPGFKFMTDSLKDLDMSLRNYGSCLLLFRGNPVEIVEEIIKNEGIECVFVNRDYTPFSRKRDERLSEACSRMGIAFESYSDLLLNSPEKTLKKDGKPYSIFSPYFKNAYQLRIPEPEMIRENKFMKKCSENNFRHEILLSEALGFPSPLSETDGGRSACLKILNNIHRFFEYEEKRDAPSLEMTTGLSAHLKFGTCSVREAYHAIKKTLGSEFMEPGFPLIRQLYWRDFFTHIAYFFPRVFGHSFHEKYDNIRWENDEKKFKAWCEGRTGFPFVDAGMRQLNETGFMHGRLRMICAAFLVKDLHIDWRWGERYFASRLTDYDPSVNNGNWQWAASTGCDSQPYFRIFNPWTQQKKFDPECKYIKKWIPELRKYPSEAIQGLEKTSLSGYVQTITDHKKACLKTKTLYSNLKNFED